MKILFTLLLIIIGSHAWGSTITIKCDRVASDQPPKIYKYEELGDDRKVFERVDADWIPLCDGRPQAGAAELGFGKESATLTVTDRGATCLKIIPFMPKRHDFEINIYQGISYVVTAKTVVDFQFLSRKILLTYDRVSEGMQPKNEGEKYLKCSLVD